MKSCFASVTQHLLDSCPDDFDSRKRETRHDFGPGLGRCGACRSFPHSNRGCGRCGTRLCKACFRNHNCAGRPSLGTVVQLKNTITPMSQCEPCGRPSVDGQPPWCGLRQRLTLPDGSRFTSLMLEKNLKSLGSTDLRGQVQLPLGACKEEWIAVNTIDFFNEFNLLAGALSDSVCTENTCPCMSAGAYTFNWCDGHYFESPTQLPAPRYIEHLLVWVERRLGDEHFLPTVPGVPFPESFHGDMSVIYKRLLRIYAHTFHAHLQELVEQEADLHLNHSFKHFITFAKEFDLIAEADVLAPVFCNVLDDGTI